MDELELEFELHPRLEADTLIMGDFPLCRVLLMNDSHFPWFILVPRRAGVSEIYHLSEEDQIQLLKESSVLSQVLADSFSARKMNVSALGNVVHQLHVHHVVRYEDDVAWPAPIWGVIDANPYSDEEVESIRQRIHTLLEGEMSFVPF